MAVLFAGVVTEVKSVVLSGLLESVFTALYSSNLCGARPARFSSSWKGITVTKISSGSKFTGILNIFCDLDLDHNSKFQFFHKTIQLMMMYTSKPSSLAKGSAVQKTY